MKLKQLEYLVKIVECGSITQAAQQLYISQPSLTKAVSNLEEEYNIQLLVRKPRGVELTAQGREFVHHARGILASVKSLETDFVEKKMPRARLFAATQQLDFIYDIFLEAFEMNNGGNLYFNLIETERNDVTRQVIEGKADIGFAVRTGDDIKNFLWNSESKRLDIHVLDKGGVYVAVGPKSVFWNRESIDIDEIEDCTQAALDMEEQVKQIFWANNYSSYKSFNNNHIVFFNTVSACEHFLMNTDAFAFISPWTSGCFKEKDINVIPVNYKEGIDELIWMKRSGEPLSPTEAYFLDKVYRHLGKKTPDMIVQSKS